jgi:phosphoserine phosphatase
MGAASTTVRLQVIDEIARHHGVYDAVADMTEYAMQGGMDFDESLRVRCKELAGCPVEVCSSSSSSVQADSAVVTGSR